MMCKDCPAFQGTYETEQRILNPNDCSCGITLQKVMPDDEYAEECIGRELLEALKAADEKGRTCPVCGADRIVHGRGCHITGQCILQDAITKAEGNS